MLTDNLDRNMMKEIVLFGVVVVLIRFHIATICMICFATFANAATLNDVRGRVLVDNGSGFKAVSAPASVSPGDRVSVRGSGQALIQFDNGCVGKVDSNQTVTVPVDPPCEPGAADIQSIVMGLAVAGGVAAVIVASQDDDDPPASP